MNKYMRCCSLAKPDPHTKSKTLVSHDRYGIVFMHGQNVMVHIATFESQKKFVCRTHLWNVKKERLRRRNQRDRDRHTAESAQQREAQLTRRRRVRDRAHCASQSAAQRERVLGYRRGRLASETPDQRMSRLELGRA